MLNKFASQIEEIAHLSLAPNATLEQVNQDLLAIAERMRESQLTPVAADSSICPSCGHIDGYHPPECMAGE
jgi:hypothetical protein